jgi:hypothetical protein
MNRRGAGKRFIWIARAFGLIRFSSACWPTSSQYGPTTSVRQPNREALSLAVFGLVKGHLARVPKMRGALQSALIGSLAAGRLLTAAFRPGRMG